MIIWKRELQSYFYTPSAYLFLGVFSVLSSLFFAVNNLSAHSSDLMNLLWMMGYLWLLLCPILTMRSLAGEIKNHTDQLLFTVPLSLPGLVLGKFAAACTVLMISVLFTGIFVLITALWGAVYLPELFCGYFGFILQGCALIALDLWISSFCRSSVSAALLAFSGNLLLWLSDILNTAIRFSPLNSVLSFVSLYTRCEPFCRGQFSIASTVYYLLFIFVMLLGAVCTLEKRRWQSA